jgi:tetratricopeptide (TPR) repeat protein
MMNFMRALLILILLFNASASFGQAAGTVDDYIKRASELKNKGDYDGSIAEYDKAIALKPNDAILYNGWALSRRGKGDLDGAMADIEKALALYPSFAEAFNNRGIIKQDKKDYDGAIADFDKALSLNPGDFMAYYNRGTTKRYKGDLDGALSDFNQALSLKPSYAAVYINRGLVLNVKGDASGALSDYEKAISLDPNNAIAYGNRGMIRFSRHDIDGASADFSKAVELNPKLFEPHINRGYARLIKGEADGALADYEIAIGLKPDDARGYGGRGLVRLAQGRDSEAEVDFKRCLELDAKFKPVLDKLAEAVRQTRKAFTDMHPQLPQTSNNFKPVELKLPKGYMPASFPDKRNGQVLLDAKRPGGMYIVYPNADESPEAFTDYLKAMVKGMFLHDSKTPVTWTQTPLPPHKGVENESGTLYSASDDKMEIQLAAYTRNVGGTKVAYGYYAMRHKGKAKKDDAILLDGSGNGVKEFDAFCESIHESK